MVHVLGFYTINWNLEICPLLRAMFHKMNFNQKGHKDPIADLATAKSSVESQKGAINIQRRSVEKQKDAIDGVRALLALHRTSLNIDSALLASQLKK